MTVTMMMRMMMMVVTGNGDDDDHSKTSRCLTVEYLYEVVDYGGLQRDVVTYAMTH